MGYRRPAWHPAAVLGGLAALCGYIAFLNTGAGAATFGALAVMFGALSVGMLCLSVKPRRAALGPSLELVGFEPEVDGVVKPPEFGWGPAAWMRLRVRNTSNQVAASDIRVVIRRVMAHGLDAPVGDGPPPRSRNNLADLHLKVADHDANTIAHIAPGEERHFDLAKLNAAKYATTAST